VNEEALAHWELSRQKQNKNKQTNKQTNKKEKKTGNQTILVNLLTYCFSFAVLKTPHATK
jgi:hypothetical protein